VAYSLPSSNSPAGFAVLSYGDPKAKAELAKLIENAIGPCFIDPYDFPHMLRRPEAIQPAKILLQCQTAPTAKQLEQFLPEGALIEPVGKSAYKVTMQAPATVAELLARSAALEPQFAVMRQAFQRPYARLWTTIRTPRPISTRQSTSFQISPACWVREPSVICSWASRRKRCAT